MEAQLAEMRVDYRRDELDVGDLAGTWHEQFRWLADAAEAGVVEPNAMVLATASGWHALERARCSRTSTSAGSSSTPTTLGEEPRPAPSRRRGDLPLECAPAAGAAGSATSSACPGGDPRLLGHPAAGLQLARGPRRSRATSPTGRLSTRASTATERRFSDIAEVPVPPHWGGWRIVPTASSSGRAGPTGCTTGWSSSRTPSTRTWQVRRLAPEPGASPAASTTGW